MSELRWTFTARCPNGHDDAHQSFERQFLEGSLTFGAPIQFHCPICDQHWDATPKQREVLSGALHAASGKHSALKKRMRV